MPSEWCIPESFSLTQSSISAEFFIKHRSTVQRHNNNTTPHWQDTAKEASKYPAKKTEKPKPPPKAAKEKLVKPKKEVTKPDPAGKAKAAGHQPGVIRGITYYKATKTEGRDGSTNNKGKASKSALTDDVVEPSEYFWTFLICWFIGS